MTESQRTPDYSRKDLQRWETDMLLKRPTTRHVGDPVEIDDCVCLDIAPLGNGMLVTIATRDGEERTVYLNPVVAAALRKGFSHCGFEGKWKDENGEPVAPVR